MPADITMPQLSDTMTEGTLVKWLKKEGDKVSAGEKIAEVETDKAVMEMESFDTGAVAALVVPEGQKAPVGALLAVIATGSENPAEVKKNIKSRSAAPVPVAVATAAAPPASRQEVAASRKPAVAVATVAAGHEGNGGERVHVSPLARRIAEQRQIDLHALRGSGPGGRIVKQDVLSQTPAPASISPPALGSGQTQAIALTKMRLAIARSLVASKQNIPHFYETIDVDVEDLVQLRAKLNDLLEPEKIRLSLGDFISKAVAVALLRHPALNATFNGSEVTRYGDVHLGMAVAIPDGLIVPVLRNIHPMGLKEIRQRSVDLVDRARAQRLKQDEMTGGTFTVSNLGTYGLREFSAIINPPQVAILAVAAAEKRPVVRGDQIVIRTMMTLTLSADHRVVDGAVAADFLRTLQATLQEPGMMLL
jgi:pyruvate dehydrogenase E2 component (dihydrolipoyllysine-residue acetyltransferase)